MTNTTQPATQPDRARDEPRRARRPGSDTARAATRVDRPRRAHAPGAARLRRQHRAELRAARHLARPRAHGGPAALDHRRLPARAGGAPRRHGQRGRSLRAPSAAADRLDRVRRGLRRRRLRADRRGAHRRARGARLLRRHAHAVDAVVAPRGLHRPRAAPPRHRDLGLGLRGRQCARPARRRTAARALRLGLGVPARGAGARADARARAPAHPREPRPRAGPHRPREHRALARRDGADRLRDQVARDRGRRRGSACRRSCWACSARSGSCAGSSAATRPCSTCGSSARARSAAPCS